MSGPDPARGAARPAVFLDRDGVLVDELDFLVDPEALRLYPGVAAAVHTLNALGWVVVVVTNQSAVARGLLDERGLGEIHERLREHLAQGGAHLDAIFHCPHHPTAGREPYRRVCDCRKPAPGLLQRAARLLGLDLARSWIVGDSARDLEAGAAVGVRGILVATGKGEREHARLLAAGRPPAVFVPDLPAAVRHIGAPSAAHS